MLDDPPDIKKRGCPGFCAQSHETVPRTDFSIHLLWEKADREILQAADHVTGYALDRSVVISPAIG